MTRRAGRLSGTDRQIRRLTDEARSRILTPADAAMIVLALPHDDVHRQAYARLLRVVTGSGAGWVTEEPLPDVMVRLLALTRHGRSGLTGERMAALARRLVGAETAVGGPYRDRDGRVTIAANAMLLQFFTEKGTDLPRVREWLGRTIEADKPDLRTVWSLTWPTVLVKEAVLPAINKPTETIADIAAALCLRDTNGAVPTPRSASRAAATARDFIATLPDEVREPARRIWAKICRVDRHAEITGISRRFVDSLTAPVALTDDMVDRLALANFYV